VPAFTYAAFQMPNVLTKIACVFIIFWAFYIVHRIRSARKHMPGSVTDNYIEYLSKTRDHLLVQKKLLDTVLWWYILPAQSGVTLFSLGVALESGSYDGLIKMEILGLGLAIVILYMNKQTLKKTLNPRLEKIDELIGVMEQR
jgi:CDP-diglyceride synthetase